MNKFNSLKIAILYRQIQRLWWQLAYILLMCIKKGVFPQNLSKIDTTEKKLRKFKNLLKNIDFLTPLTMFFGAPLAVVSGS